MAHALLEHWALAPGNAASATLRCRRPKCVVGPELQPPQWVAEVAVVTSQPSLHVPLQSARPASQVAMAQALLVH